MMKLALAAGAMVVALTGGAFAADLAPPMSAPPEITPPAATTNWDGPYIGATLGYDWGSASGSSGSGFLIGGQVGYNFHLADAIVAGVQGNIDWVNVSGSSGSSWDGALTARLGYDVDSVLPYVEAGVAFDSFTGGGSSNTGYVLGAGVEFMLADQLSANVEYRYEGFSGFSDNQFRVGLNYHF
jgi:outer membrane immunogenic protein